MSYEIIDNVISFSKMKRNNIIFLQNIFPIISNGKIRVMTLGKFNNSSYFYESIECIKDFRYDTYFSLSLTNGNSGKREDLISRSCLAFDFDLSDYCGIDKEILHNISEEDPKRLNQLKDELFNYILNKSTEIGLYIHYIVDSGYGYHVYHLISTTNDFKKVEDVQLAIAELFHYVDPKALDITRVLRLPGSYNTKGKRNLPTHIVVDNTKDSKMHRKSIENLYKRYCLHIHNNTTDTKEVNRELNTVSKSDYIENILNNGVEEGLRNKWLTNLTVYFRNNNYKLDDTMVKMKEWASKINYKDNIEYRITYAYNNINSYIDLTDEEKKEIFNSSYSYFNWNKEEEYGIIEINKKLGRRIKNKGMKMKGREIFIYNVLASKATSLSIEDILCLITDENKIPVLKERAIKESLKELINYDIVEKIGKAYTTKENSKSKFIKISYFINLAVIWKKITLEELRFYTYLRIRQSQLVEEGKAFGCELSGISMETMADEFGIKDRHTIGEYLKKFTKLHIIDRVKIPIDKVKFTYKYFLNK